MSKLKTFTDLLDSKYYSYEVDGGCVTITHEDYVWLPDITILDVPTHFNNECNVSLPSLIRLSEGTQFNNKGSVNLRSLETLTNDIRFNNDGMVYLKSLMPQPSLRQFNNNGAIYFQGLTVPMRKLKTPVPKSLADMSDLPDELKAELSIFRTTDIEDKIIIIVNSCDGKEANIDTILIEFYRRYNTIYKRTYITNKIWRMVKKNRFLWGGSGGKGYYTTINPTMEKTDE